MTAGRFITFEGIDGAGKTTQLAQLAQLLRDQQADVVVTREPGGTALGEKLRSLLLSEQMGAESEALLMFAARAEHLQLVIWPALRSGRWVLCDRFTDASYAYQGGGRGLPAERITQLEAWLHSDLQPDLTFYFDLPVDVALRRRSQARSADRFEGEAASFHGAVRSAYLQRAGLHPERIVVIDATRDQAAIAAEIAQLIGQWQR